MFELMNEASINPSILLIGGIVLMLGEVLIVGTFVLFWVALAFILIGAVSFAYPLDWQWQLVAITLLGTLFTWFLNPYLKKSKHTQEADTFAPQNETVQIGKIHIDRKGEISIFYKGTYWLIDPRTPIIAPQNAAEVKILEVNGNYVQIQLL